MQERNYGIDLLRLVLMYMVCILHTLKQGGILSTCEIGGGSYKVYWLLEIFSLCAVDGFALISGYMAKDKPRKYSKLAEMWFQVFFYSFVVTIVLTIMGFNEHLGVKDAIKNALPVTFETYWYFTAYFALFFATPILNKFIFSIDEVASKKTFIIMFALFSLIGALADSFKTQWGYSALWLMVLYCMGALAKRIKLFESKKTVILILLWLVCVFLTWSLHVFSIGGLTNYISPTVLMSGLLMVILFSRLHLKGNIIAKLSPLAFGIYLLQLNPVVWSNILKDAFVFVASKNIMTGILYVFGLAFLIFFSGLIVEFIRTKLAQALKISVLSDRIVSIADKIITKVLVVLK